MRQTKYILGFLWLCIGLPACEARTPVVAKAEQPEAGKEPQAPLASDSIIIDPSGQTLMHRILPPTGFRRETYGPGTFGAYLQNIPVKDHGSKVMLFNGREKNRQDVHAAILDIDVGNRDLQQCADAVIRLRAEYLWQTRRYEDIHFNFTNGFRADYSRWRGGERIRVQGDEVSWVHRTSFSDTYADFRRYLVMVFSYAGTISLEKELKATDLSQIEAGDVFIRSGSPGHAVIVMDKAVHESTGEILVLLAQSYMPAQDIHILVNPANRGISPWYSTRELTNFLITPEWRFSTDDLKSF